MQWVDPEWAAPLKTSLVRIRGMYDDENKLMRRGNVANAEENIQILRKGWKMSLDFLN